MRLIMLKTCVVVAFLILCVIPAAAQQKYCTLHFTMLNSTRHVVGEVNTECSWPGIPFGNWGVESNFGGRYDGYQFAGWKYMDNWYQWNSCTSEYVREANCWDHYNHDHNGNGLCEDQGSTQGEYQYAGGVVNLYANCPYDYNDDGQCDTGGCLGISQFGFSGQYLDLWELDEFPNPDDYVGKLTVHSSCCTATGITCTARECYGPRYSATYPTVQYSPPSLNTTANVRLRFDYGEFVDQSGYCAYMGMWDPRYNCW